MEPAEARAELVRLLAEPPSPFPLDRAALLLAVDEYPGLELAPFEAQLDDYARRVGEPEDPDPRRRLIRLTRVLYEDEALHGNRDAYYDVRNSYLNEVLQRKLGIPISLAVVLLGVGRRLGWPLEGVNFPNHFLVAYRTPHEDLPLDPFDGLLLGIAELQERWRHATGRAAPEPFQMLEPAPPGQILLRMLNNIRLVHARDRDYARAATATEKMALIEPQNASYERDLGYFLAAAQQFQRALLHLENYLTRMPQAPDSATVREHVAGLRASLADAE